MNIKLQITVRYTILTYIVFFSITNFEMVCVHNGCFVKWISPDFHACSVHVDCRFMDKI